MAESSGPGLGDLMNMVGGTNLLASIGKNIDQFKKGISDFLSAVENFNKTMETINEIATRANKLFDDVEEPIRAMMPQVTRSIKTAEAVINQISGPIEKVAPGISRLAETLGSPVFTTMPTDIAGFVDAMGDVARRLQPLAQMAENAGSLFGLRPLSLLGGSSQSSPPPPRPQPPAPAPALAPSTKKIPAKKAPAKKAAAMSPRTSAPKKAPAKKAAAKKTTAKKAPARKTTR